MPIDHVEAGKSVTDVKTNEIIDAINAVTALLGASGVVGLGWITFTPTAAVVLGSGGIAGVLTDVGAAVRFTFDVPFADADSYSAVCTSTVIPGKTTGISQLKAQAAEYVEFGWVVDDGATGYPTRASIHIMWNLAL